MRHTEVARLCSELRLDPMHNLSLHSKELFHSNLLAWTAERFPDLAADLFGPEAGPGDPGQGPRVTREKNHLDLVLRLPGLRRLVVENKVWSLPDDHQLLRYSSGDIDDMRGEVAPVLLSMSAPLWDGPTATVNGIVWTHLSYQALAERLSESVSHRKAATAPNDHFSLELIERYAAYLKRLCYLADAAGGGGPDDSVWLDPDIYAVLASARLQDALS